MDIDLHFTETLFYQGFQSLIIFNKGNLLKWTNLEFGLNCFVEKEESMEIGDLPTCKFYKMSKNFIEGIEEG